MVASLLILKKGSGFFIFHVALYLPVPAYGNEKASSDEKEENKRQELYVALSTTSTSEVIYPIRFQLLSWRSNSE